MKILPAIFLIMNSEFARLPPSLRSFATEGGKKPSLERGGSRRLTDELYQSTAGHFYAEF